MSSRSRHAFQLAILLGTALALAGCDTIRNASGGDKEPPDEFAVVTKAPLIIPPDYNLRPPQPGAAPTNQLAPTQSAEQALFSADNPTGAQAITGNYSDGEKTLLANAGAQNADPTIRQDLVADDTAQQTSDDSFTNQVLFWNGPSAPPDQSLNADTAAAQVSAQQAAGPTAPPAATPGSTEPNPAADTNVSDSATIDKDNKHQAPDNTDTDKNQSSGGWFDWF